MIRQLPKLTVPSFVRDTKTNMAATAEGGADVKIYDIITEATSFNTEGNSLQLQLFHKDSEEANGERQLHGRLVLSAKRQPQDQDLSFGFAFAESDKKDFFDGLSVQAKVNNPWNTQFTAIDIHSAERPNIEKSGPTAEQNSDWLLREKESTQQCDSELNCEYSVVFVRKFITGDSADDIDLVMGEERNYSLTGFYRFTDKEKRVTSIGQSSDMSVLMGAFNALTVSYVAASASILTLTMF